MIAGGGYAQYLASPAWAQLRALAQARDGHRCRGCNRAERLEVHHRAYPPWGHWEADRLENLTTLCRDCHQALPRNRAKKT